MALAETWFTKSLPAGPRDHESHEERKGIPVDRIKSVTTDLNFTE
jgi:hypothetical protein